MITRLEELLRYAQSNASMRLVVAAAQDEDVLEAVCTAAEQGMVVPIMIGDRKRILDIAREKGLNLGSYEVVDCPDLKASAELAVQYIKAGKGDYLMKGLIDTSILLKAVLGKDSGLRTDKLLSHVMVYETPHYHKLIFLSDGGMNVAPGLEEKAQIIENAVAACKAMGCETVKVACLAAKEKVNEKMSATVDARALQDMGAEGRFGVGVLVEGPLALDLAVSKEAAEIKGFKSEVAGDADVLLVPTIEMGNGIGKALTCLGGADSAGVIMGARVPVVLVSRADSYQAKLNAIAFGSVVASQCE